MSAHTTLTRRWLRHGAALALLAVLAACGGGGSNDAPAPATAPVTTNPGAPTSGDPGSAAAPADSTSAAAPVPAGSNVLPILLDRGADGSAINSPFVTVTVCAPGSGNCRTVDHILLDTGSVGLRVNASALGTLALPAVKASGGALAECGLFASGYAWGSVRSADVRLAGQQANALPVQVMDDPASPYAKVPADCADTGPALPDAGSNGILGVGFDVQDCGSACASSVASRLPGVYFSCTAAGCAIAAAPLDSQLAHPVAALASADNNGLSIVLPDVSAGGSQRVAGSLVLGIGTRANNQLGATPVYTARTDGNFTTTYKGAVRPAFIDSGSNGIFFPDSAIPLCSSGFYCPASPLALSATATGVNGTSVAVPFTVVNAGTLPFGTAAARLGGSVILGSSFDWGLPFFFGRKVFVAISGRATPAGSGPFWAF